MSYSHTFGELPDPPESYDEPERFPVVMIYMTIKVDHNRGWTDSVRVQTPDGKTTIRSWGRSGGSLIAGLYKAVDDLTEAWRLAAHVEPFCAPERIEGLSHRDPDAPVPVDLSGLHTAITGHLEVPVTDHPSGNPVPVDHGQETLAVE